MSEFFVGQKVICMGAKYDASWSRINLPQKKMLYTIRTIDRFKFLDKGDMSIGEEVSFLLSEIHNCIRDCGRAGVREPHFPSYLFRPLESKAIELFRQIARDVTEGKKVRVSA